MFGEATLGKLNHVKLLCSLSSSTLWDPTLARSNQEIKLCITKHIPLCDSSVHAGTPFSVPSSSSETNRVSKRHSSLVTISSSRMILGKPKNEVIKVLTHQVGKNEEGFSNFISSKQYRSPYTLPDPGQHESRYNLLHQWDPGEKPLLPQLFRTTTSAKIIYFPWIQSEYNLSCMLVKHWELLKILQVIDKLLILYDLIPLISRSAI